MFQGRHEYIFQNLTYVIPFSEPDVRYSYTYLYPQISYNDPVKSLLEFEVMDLFSNAKAPYSR